MITVMLTLERPEQEKMRGFDRAQKYRALKSSASGIREELVRWIEEHGLTEDVAEIGEPTVFNTLFVTSTPSAASQLAKAPGVLDVAPAGDFRVDLLSAAGEVSDREPSPSREEDPGDCSEECD
ncbi:MAG: hypothetical protein PVG11_05315 [Anaerolineae bacterium]|jgi:hypothetical protein